MFEVEDLRDEPVNVLDNDTESYGHLLHDYTKVCLEQRQPSIDVNLKALSCTDVNL